MPVPRSLRDGIAVEHVSFRYPSSTRLVLEDITMRIEGGETVALVGENGSGKTTLVKLLCRLYDPDTGWIAIDGADIRDFDVAALRGLIAVCFQDYAKYHLSARENIGFGDIRLPLDSPKIVEAAHRADVDLVLSGLPHGYDSVLGKWFQDGEELSLGEWQKVALARAFVRDAPVILLDEPTGALDARAAHEIFESFREAARNRTTLLISHRLSTVRLADRIYVLEGGRIAENGTHDELMARPDGVYARLFEMQAKRYR